MILILEGPNKVGKSTLAKEISALTGAIVYKNNLINDLNVPKEEIRAFVQGGILEVVALMPILATMGTNIIFDRFHITEWVYGNLRRNYNPDYIWDVDESLSKIANVKIAFMTDEIGRINARYGYDSTPAIGLFNFAQQNSKINKRVRVYQKSLAKELVKELNMLRDPKPEIWESEEENQQDEEK